MKKYYYPAILHKAEEGGFWVSFPDIPECFSQGENLDEAYKMAHEALELSLGEKLVNGEDFPTAMTFNKIKTKKCDVVAIIEFDYDAYMRKHNSKSVKKTLSIPEWLNEEALSRNINFSKVLQDALIEMLG